MPFTRQSLLEQLSAWGIRAATYDHAPVFTVAEGALLKAALPGAHTKNLFLKDRSGTYFLVSALAESQINLPKLSALLGAKGRLSFGSAEQMMETLGVTPGSVTALALINDPEQRVRFVLDHALLGAPLINFHPLRNDATTALTPDDLVLFLQKLNRAWECVEVCGPDGPVRRKMD